MIRTSQAHLWLATLSFVFVISLDSAQAGEPGPSKPDPKASTTPSLSLLDAMRAGAVSVDPQGREDGNINLNVTNLTGRKLRVVLPPGLIATGASGQFGGMGGMGGMGGGMGGGGMGGMGGGMGGMGGGMGGMGGGMGGMGGGMGGMGGGMGGRGMSGAGRPLTMMPMQGLSSVANMIMNLVQPETWDRRAFMRGMMAAMGSMGGGMMGGMGMGGMGGGMGGMGGGMGGGFRSVPPTDLPTALLQPGQTRELATRVVSLNPPSPQSGVLLPKPGERLLIGDVAQISTDLKVQKALRRLARDDAPEIIAQLVMWNLAGKLDWLTIGQLTNGWVNAQELALAQQFVEQLNTLTNEEAGQLFIDVTAGEKQHESLAGELGQALPNRMVLGLRATSGLPIRPSGPSVGCKVQLVGEPGKPEALVQVAESNGHREWTSMGKFNLPVPTDVKGQPDLVAFGDKLAEGLLERLVRARMIRRQTLGGTPTYTYQVDNASPLLLNSFAVVGTQAKPTEPPHFMLGISIPPQRSLQFSLTAAQVESFGMKKGTHLIALDLSAL